MDENNVENITRKEEVATKREKQDRYKSISPQF
jgi:hypothetical protein